MSKYTPTPGLFRHVYGYMCAEWNREDALAEFDRMIARVKAEAWDECAESAGDMASALKNQNPYQIEGDNDE